MLLHRECAISSSRSGAESGRAILGRLDGDVLTLKDVRRFPNVAVRTNGSLHWDILRLWHEVKTSLEDVSDVTLASVGLDTWGCDFALLGEQGQLLENPYHYRDTRSDDAPSQVFRHVSADRIYATTGIQFLNFNSLFQLYSAKRSTPGLLRAATAFVTIPDLLNYWLTGRLASEYTIATTTQMIDAERRSWATLSCRSSICRRTCSSRRRTARSSAEFDTTSRPRSRHAGGGARVTTLPSPRCPPTRRCVSQSGTWSLSGAEVGGPSSRARP